MKFLVTYFHSLTLPFTQTSDKSAHGSLKKKKTPTS